MAVLRGNVAVRSQAGVVVKLVKGMERDDLEAQVGRLGERAQEILDNPGHWVDVLPDDGSHRRNLLGDDENLLVKPRGTAEKRRGGTDDEPEPKRKPRKPAPKGVVEA